MLFKTEVEMAHYSFQGKMITIDDDLIAQHKKVWFDVEPDEQLFDRYFFSLYGHSDKEFLQTISEKELSEKAAMFMREEIEVNR